MSRTIKSPITDNNEADNSVSIYPYELQVHYNKLSDPLRGFSEKLSCVEQKVDVTASPRPSYSSHHYGEEHMDVKLYAVLKRLVNDAILEQDHKEQSFPYDLPTLIQILKKMGLPIKTKQCHLGLRSYCINESFGRHLRQLIDNHGLSLIKRISGRSEQ